MVGRFLCHKMTLGVLALAFLMEGCWAVWERLMEVMPFLRQIVGCHRWHHHFLLWYLYELVLRLQELVYGVQSGSYN